MGATGHRSSRHTTAINCCRACERTAHGSVDSTELEYNGTRLFLIDLAFGSDTTVPERLEHCVSILGGGTPSLSPKRLVPPSYLVAPLPLERTTLEIGAPLAGKGWVAVNGCCGPDGVHRAASVTVNGQNLLRPAFRNRLDAPG
jgi:hypothetical protein